MTDLPKLPADVSRCQNEGCELHAKCLRFLSPPHRYQVWTLFSGGPDCHGFMEVRND